MTDGRFVAMRGSARLLREEAHGSLNSVELFMRLISGAREYMKTSGEIQEG